jgi:hypothetical protein
VLDHLCRNPACVNPDHLEPVTNAENSRRGAKPVITMEIARQIRATHAEGRLSNRSIAKHLGISKDCVNAVVNGETWRE